MMRSVLTRNVFRRLLTNEPLVFRCPTRQRQAIQSQNGASRHFTLSTRRHIFGLGIKPARVAKDEDLAPGLRRMLDLDTFEKLRTRPPLAIDLIKAFNSFFNYKTKSKEPVNRIQATHALRTFRHLRDNNIEEEDFGLTLSDLLQARDVMAKMPNDESDLHYEFAKELFAEIKKRKGNMHKTEDAGVTDLLPFIKVLAATGHAAEAREHTEQYWMGAGTGERARTRWRKGIKMWELVVDGYAREGAEENLLEIMAASKDVGVPYTSALHGTMCGFYAKKNDVVNTKLWYEKDIEKGEAAFPTTQSEILQFCLRNNELEWSSSVFRKILTSNPNKPTWDVVFMWAATAMGKGVEDVERMMEVMIRRNAGDPTTRPDAETFNGLVEFAMSKKDSYLAERYLALAAKSGILPNARTYILQMEYRIDAGDLSGAQTAYDALQGQELVDAEDLPVINHYIRALCNGPPTNYEKIALITGDLEERKARLEADTVSALSIMYLQKNDLNEVLNVINSNSFHYSREERKRVRDALLAFCMDPKSDTSQAWDSYIMIRQAFDETDTATRELLMDEFFRRKRCDMACHVFGHMRQHIRPEKRPKADTYVRCFEGIATCGDSEHLEMVHNMMKMDSSIEPSTRLLNSLMIAYTACDDPYRALQFWTDITNSNEGPTYNSLEIVFRACETKPFGEKQAKDIWNKMRRMEIEVTPSVFNAYLGALAGQALIEEVQGLVEGMQSDVGFGPDATTIGTVYNAAPGLNRKDDVEQWAKGLYPELWAELEKIGRITTEEEIELFNIVRVIKA